MGDYLVRCVLTFVAAATSTLAIGFILDACTIFSTDTRPFMTARFDAKDKQTLSQISHGATKAPLTFHLV